MKMTIKKTKPVTVILCVRACVRAFCPSLGGAKAQHVRSPLLLQALRNNQVFCSQDGFLIYGYHLSISVGEGMAKTINKMALVKSLS